MFKIIDAIGKPLALPWHGPNVELGNVVTLSSYDLGGYFKLSNSKNPFGIVSAIDNSLLYVFCSFIIFQTDNFEHDAQYNCGDFLYSNNNGVLTTRKEEENSLLLAYVNNCTNNYIEVRLI